MVAIIFADEAKRRRNRRMALRIAAAGSVAAIFGWGTYSISPSTEQPGQVESSSTHLGQEVGKVGEGEIRAVPNNRELDLSGGTRLRSANAPEDVACDVTDGDTLNCAGRRIRLIGIDAPELPGHCRPGRDCVDGDPFAASRALGQLIQVSNLQIVVTGRDAYGRELANVYADGKNVACDLIAGGFAVYVPKWDEDNIVEEDCTISGL